MTDSRVRRTAGGPAIGNHAVLKPLKYSLLGSFEARRGRDALPLGPPQQQAMLAALLLRAGQTVTATSLSRAVWGPDAPASAVTTIRTYAWRLRKIIEPGATKYDVFLSRGDGYCLIVDRDDVDVFRAEVMAASAEDRARSGDLRSAHDLVRETLLLWRGEPLAGLSGPLAEQQRLRLDELRLTLLERRIDLGILLGRGRLEIPEINALVSAHPLREYPYALLMRAQYQAGHRAEALATYRSLRELSVAETGLEPGPDLADLHASILAGDWAESVPATVSMVPGRVPQEASEDGRGVEDAVGISDIPPEALERVRMVPAQLPPAQPGFVGRTELLRGIRAVLGAPDREQLPVVALHGVGGVGKTALALHAAHGVRDSYPSGQLHADLRGSSANPEDPTAVLGRFLTALGLPARDVPDDLDSRTALYRSFTDGRAILVVLDDARDTAQVRPLLPGTPHSGVVVTSRSPLAGLPAAREGGHVPVLGPDEAIGLLTGVLGTARIAAERAAAADVAAACGHHPLALRIAALRLAGRPDWRLEECARDLWREDRGLAGFSVGELSLEEPFEAACHALTADQKRAFRLGACLDGSVSAEVVGFLLEGSTSFAENLLDSLVDASLLEAVSAGRYRYPRLLRSFARGKAEDVLPWALTRATEFLLSRACWAFERVRPGESPFKHVGAVRTLDGDARRPARSGDWGPADDEDALTLAAQVARHIEESDGASLSALRQALRPAVNLLITLCLFREDVQGRTRVVLDGLIRAAQLAGDRRAEARAGFLRGRIALAEGQPDMARRQWTRALEQSRDEGDDFVLGATLDGLGKIARSRGRYEVSKAYHGRAAELARRAGSASAEAVAVANRALAEIDEGRPESAVASCQEILDRGHDGGCPGGRAHVSYALGLAHYHLGAFQKSAHHYRQGLELCLAAGLRDREAPMRFRMAQVLEALGGPEQALSEYERALHLWEALGDPHNQACALEAIGLIRRLVGPWDRAGSDLARAHRIFQDLRVVVPAREPLRSA